MHFVTRKDCEKILEACPDAEWRLIFALARFGGFRTPSETWLLRWEDVNWGRGRITVHSPKTEHHESRVIPLYPELLPHLREVYEQAEAGPKYVITRYRMPTLNLRKPFKHILRRAGLEPWPRLFQNLRASRETELLDQFPLKAVVYWRGNSAPIACKHYLMVRDEDYDRASGAARNWPHSDTARHCPTLPTDEENGEIDAMAGGWHG